MFVNSANYSTYTLELVQFCDFNKYVIRVETDPTDPTGVYRQEDNISVVIRVETDPTDPTGVYRQDDNIVEVPDNEVTDIYSPLMDATEPFQQNSWLCPDTC